MFGPSKDELQREISDLKSRLAWHDDWIRELQNKLWALEGHLGIHSVTRPKTLEYRPNK
jgi:hypothetical protein